MSTRPRDPREIITPDAFTVAPHLLGLPLARPRRRLAAIALDMVVLAVMIKAFSIIFLPVVAALLFLRASRPTQTGGVLRRGARRMLQVVGVVLIVIFVVQGGNRVQRLFRDDDDRPAVTVGGADTSGATVRLRLADIAALRLVDDFGDADNEEEARTSARAIVAWINERSQSPAERAEFARMAEEALEEEDYLPVLQQELAPLLAAAPRAQPRMEPVVALAQALERGDSAAADSLRRAAEEAVAGERIARLTASVQSLEAENARLERAIEEQRRGIGIRRLLSGLSEDLGVGFGWFALYFTAFGVLWKGQTPGKRLLGLRIIRLDGRPLSWWLSFERFGGYAASASTGLLGFAQILWDRNRQGLHDKAVETVVIRERGEPSNARTLP